MKPSQDPEITSVNRVDNAVSVTFDDDTSALYPASLLHAAMGVADAILEKDLEKHTEEKP